MAEVDFLSAILCDSVRVSLNLTALLVVAGLIILFFKYKKKEKKMIRGVTVSVKCILLPACISLVRSVWQK